MNPKQLAELKQHDIDNPPEDMIAELVCGTADSNLMDMHYSMIQDEDFDGKFEEGFYIF